MTLKVRLLPVTVAILVIVPLAACGEEAAPEPAVTTAPTPAVAQASPGPVVVQAPEPTSSEEPSLTPAATPRPSATPAPTATPTPTPSPTPTRTPVSANGILEVANAAMQAVDSFHFEMTIVVGFESEGASIELPIIFAGDFKRPNSIQGSIAINLGFFNVETEIVGIGDEVYIRDLVTGEWDVSTGQDALPASPEDLAGIETDSLGDVSLLGTEVLDGVEVFVITGLAEAGSVVEGQGETVMTYWVGKDDSLLRKITAVGDADLSAGGGNLLGGLPGGDASVDITVELSAFDEAVTIARPDSNASAAGS
mgnify:CR=1 FL=1